MHFTSYFKVFISWVTGDDTSLFYLPTRGSASILQATEVDSGCSELPCIKGLCYMCLLLILLAWLHVSCSSKFLWLKYFHDFLQKNFHGIF